eukprot:4692694-Prymnesium_polylepis.1
MAAHMRTRPMAQRRTAWGGRRADTTRRPTRVARTENNVMRTCGPAMGAGRETPQRQGQRQRPWRSMA